MLYIVLIQISDNAPEIYQYATAGPGHKMGIKRKRREHGRTSSPATPHSPKDTGPDARA